MPIEIASIAFFAVGFEIVDRSGRDALSSENIVHKSPRITVCWGKIVKRKGAPALSGRNAGKTGKNSVEMAGGDISAHFCYLSQRKVAVYN